MWRFVWRGSIGADTIQIMLIAPNLLSNAYLSNAFDWSNTPLLAWAVAARRRDRIKQSSSVSCRLSWHLSIGCVH